MHVTLLVAGALVPAALAEEIARALDVPRLAARLARSTLVEEIRAEPPLQGAAHLAWINPRIFGTEVDAPTAPYAFAALSGDRPQSGAQYFHADLVHLGFARDHLVVEPLGIAPTSEERGALREAANAVGAAHGVRFVEIGEAGFMQSALRWDLATVPLAAALGGSATALLSSGADAQRWSRLHNEIQMIWHSHPVNVAREERGVPTIDGIWLHGGGRWEPLATPPYSAVHSNEPEFRGAALAVGVNSAHADAPAADNSLVIRVEPFVALREGDWTAWLAAIKQIDTWLAPLGSVTIDLVLAGRDTVRVRRSTPWDRFRRWRAMPLAEAIAE
ncbi:MAG: hypothetical protein ACREBN_07415 [Burkholderiaceae bacterium]